MKYALVIVEDKNNLSKGTQSLRSLASSLEASGVKSPQIECLNVGAYIIPLEHGLHALSRIVSQAEADKLSLRTLFFQDEPAWVITSCDKVNNK